MRNIFKNKIKQLIGTLGYEVHRSPEVCLQQFDTIRHPAEAVYARHEHETVGFKASLNSFCNYTGLSYGKKGWHPFVSTLDAYMRNHHSYEGSPLERYYATWQPTNAKEAFITFDHAPDIFIEKPAVAFVSPWHTISINERLKDIEANIRSENRKAGLPEVGAKGGFSLHGPVIPAKGQVEFERLIYTFESIQKNGFIIESLQDLIVGFALLNDSGDFRIVVIHGNHRLASLTALGKTHVLIRLVAPFVARRDEVQWWPQVQSGLWTQKDAKRYFDSLFESHSTIRTWAQRHDFAL